MMIELHVQVIKRTVYHSSTTSKDKDDQQLKTKLLKEANDIQNELYNFKLRSREIQAKIQSDIDSVIIISERFKTCTTYLDLLNALIMLLNGLRESKRFVAEMRNHYKEPAPIFEPPASVMNASAMAASCMSGSTNLRRMRKKDLLRQYWTQDMNMDATTAQPSPLEPLSNQNPKITPQELKDCIHSLKYKTYDVKWFSVSLVSELAHLRLLRKTMAQTLSANAGSPVQAQTCAPKQMTGSAGASLSRLLLAKMHDLVGSLSPATVESSSDLPTFQSAIPSDSPPPTPAKSVSPNAGSHPRMRILYKEQPNQQHGCPSTSKPQPSPSQSSKGNAAQNEKTNAENETKVKDASEHLGPASTPDPTLSKQLSELNQNEMLRKLLPETSKSPASDLPTEPAPSAATEPLPTPPPSATTNASAQKQVPPDPGCGFGSRSECEPQPAPTQPAQGSAGLKAERKDISDMKVSPELAKQANDFQNELYRLKVKSCEIAAKLKKDIHAVNSNIDFHSLYTENVPKEWTVKHFLHSLLELKSKLSKAKADAVILRKKCKFSTPMRVKPELDQMSRRLQTSFNNMLFSESLVRAASKRERLLIETMARALCDSNKSNGLSTSRNNDNDPDPAPGFAASSPGSPLSKLLSELSTMLRKLSPPLSTRPNAGQSSQNEKISDMKVSPELVKQANDFQNELYRFKEKSREIAAEIQKDIDAVNSNKYINSLDLDVINVHRKLNIKYFLLCLHFLKSQLAKAKADVAILRNKSVPTSDNPDLYATSRQLKLLFNAMMQSESLVRANSKQDRLLIETMAHVLYESNKSVNGFSASQASEFDPPRQTSRTPTPDPETQTKILAEKKLDAGQEFYKLAKYKEAVQMFSEACELCPASSCYLIKRSDALMMLGEHERALRDSQIAVALEPTTCEAGYVIIAKCCFKLGDIEGSEEAVRSAIELFGEASVSKESLAVTQLRSMQEEARYNIDLKLYQNALRAINNCLQLSPACYETLLIKAEFRANTNDYEESAKIAHEIMPHLDERLLPGVYYVLGLCSFHQGENVEAIKWFQKIDKPNRYQKNAREFFDLAKRRAVLQKKEEGKKAFEKGKYIGALNLYIEALDINIEDDHINATLHYNKATVLAKLNRTREAEQACTVALDLKHDYIKALERRAHCCTELGEHEDALEDYRRLVELYKKEKLEDRKIKDLLSKAEKALATFKRTNYYYNILGVKNNVKAEDIKKAYRKRSLLYHPDKVSFQEKCVADRGACRFRRVNEAYQFLNDTVKRRNYDRRQGADDDDDDDDCDDDGGDDDDDDDNGGDDDDGEYDDGDDVDSDDVDSDDDGGDDDDDGDEDDLYYSDDSD